MTVRQRTGVNKVCVFELWGIWRRTHFLLDGAQVSDKDV